MVKLRSGKKTKPLSNDSQSKLNKLPKISSNIMKVKKRRWSSMNSKEIEKLSKSISPVNEEINPKYASAKTNKSKKISKQPFSPSKLKIKTNNNKQESTLWFLLKSLCFWYPNEVTWTLYGCLVSIGLSCFYFSYFDNLNDFNDPKKVIYLLGLSINIFDLIVNFMYALSDDDEQLLITIMHSESLSNHIQFLILLMIFDFIYLPYIWLITVTLLLTLNSNIYYKDDNSLFVRFLTYLPFIIIFGFGAIMMDFNVSEKLLYYIGFIAASMFLDLTDMPDALFDDVSICEALVLISRTVALYYLITNFTGAASLEGKSLPPPFIPDPMN
mmetsp:Transcript_18039/g.22147  ORF Transcript_18039/g.22147 Transcript_18039/m.22147 type:complete len:328 (-) Transcript_18039:93-1076(-)